MKPHGTEDSALADTLLAVTLSKLGSALKRLDEAGQAARDFDHKMKGVMGEVENLRRSLEGRWQEALRSRGDR
jgi:hypothetical protein